MKFKLNFLGIGSGFNVELGNSSAFFKDEYENLYLIDCGFDVFGKIMKYKILDGVNNITVFITHLHDDHMGSLATLMFYCYYVLNKKITIKFPDMDLARLLKIQGGLLCSNMNMTRDGCVTVGKNTILEYEFIPTIHIKTIPCYSLSIKNTTEEEPQCIYYSGDTLTFFSGCLKDDESSLEIYQDCTHEKKMEDTGHISLDTLCHLIPLKHRGQVCCIHLGDCPPEKVIEKGFRIPVVYKPE